MVRAGLVVGTTKICTSRVGGRLSSEGLRVATHGKRCVLLSGAIKSCIGDAVFRLPSGVKGKMLIAPAIRNGLLMNPATMGMRSGNTMGAAVGNLSRVTEIYSRDIGGIPLHRIVASFTNLHTRRSKSSFMVNRSTSMGKLVGTTNVRSPKLSSTPTVNIAITRLMESLLGTRRGSSFGPIERKVLSPSALSLRREGRLVGRGPTCKGVVYHYRVVARKRVLSTVRHPLNTHSLSKIGHQAETNVKHYRSKFYSPGIVRVLRGRIRVPISRVKGGNIKSRFVMNRGGRLRRMG